jgi:hypothetical protein
MTVGLGHRSPPGLGNRVGADDPGLLHHVDEVLADRACRALGQRDITVLAGADMDIGDGTSIPLSSFARIPHEVRLVELAHQEAREAEQLKGLVVVHLAERAEVAAPPPGRHSTGPAAGGDANAR